MKTQLLSRQAPGPSGPYSQGIRAGGRVYVSGQRPARPSDNSISRPHYGGLFPARYTGGNQRRGGVVSDIRALLIPFSGTIYE
ncbi:MAG: RidA family protein [Desulfovibrio sp.]|nr:RidA family protein [Desulfovibrio sp.]